MSDDKEKNGSDKEVSRGDSGGMQRNASNTLILIRLRKLSDARFQGKKKIREILICRAIPERAPYDGAADEYVHVIYSPSMTADCRRENYLLTI